MLKCGVFFIASSNCTYPHSPLRPDINVIENIWATLETAVQKHNIRDKNHLKQVLHEEWGKISPDTTKNWLNQSKNMQPSIDSFSVCDVLQKFHWCILNSLR